MHSDLSTIIKAPLIDYSNSNSQVPFSDYIANMRSLIEERRLDLQQDSVTTKLIINANSPFELQPIYGGHQAKYGVLLIHGLLDCPFSLRDIAEYLQASGMLCRGILLPGHGTTPSDLLSISYHDWIQSVRYGIETLKKEVDHIYLIGYSTGAALSIFHALQEEKVAGIILLAPAIRIKAPVDIVVGWHYLTRWFSDNKQWLYSEKEIDYTKYLSIPFNAINQVSLLTKVIGKLREQQSLTCPIFMAVSHEDETISSHKAIDFFSSLHNQASQLLLYTAYDHAYPDSRIITRYSCYPDLNIKHFSHVSIPFAPNNAHYGQHGDYAYASHRATNGFIFGAYNRIETGMYDILNKMKIIKHKRRELTYNPDFNFMAEKIVGFIKNAS
jgi:esterase/lipase